jgi:Domain of unknown function (DUF6259)
MAEPIVLENAHLRIELSAGNGSIQQITNKARGLHLIRFPTNAPPWRIEFEGQADWFHETRSFTWDLDDGGRAVKLRWETSIDLTVEGRVELTEDEARFSIGVLNGADHRLDKIEYPIIRGIGDLSDDADSYLAHSQGTGFLFRQPYHLFEAEPIRKQGLRYSPYPEGFSGSSMQFMAYFAAGQGGFDFTAHDPTGAMKWLNFFKSPDGALECTFMHQAAKIVPGRDFAVPYPILIGALVEGNWYEAADRYKAWSTKQPWVAKGLLSSRTDRCVWLLDEVGLATFGINPSHDRSRWLDRFHAMTNQPAFHILGVNWPKAQADYHNHLPAGREDWFPARFHEANLTTIRRNGDYWAPFEFDLLLDPHGTDGERIAAAHQQFPDEKHSFDQYHFPFVCPVNSYLPELHRWRDETIVRDYGADALYYDISVNNVLMTCRAPHHGHPIGGGSWMVGAYARMYAATKQAMSEATGEYVPQGAEMITECMIQSFDFYQARAEASPLSAFEADFFRTWIRQGEVEKIPLFAYVYHEYGPVRLDGWAKLSPEVGELFYWVASRVALWGGLFELNYEFSPLETLDGMDDDPTEHYYAFEPRSYEVDPAKIDFVREVAMARTGFANAYLAYGMMLRPLAFESPEIDLDYFLYNVGTDRPHYGETGTLRVPSVVHAAWRAPDGRLGFLFVNLHRDRPQSVALAFDAVHYGFSSDAAYSMEVITATSRETIASGNGRTHISFTLQPRRVTLLEVARADEH